MTEVADGGSDSGYSEVLMRVRLRRNSTFCQINGLAPAANADELISCGLLKYTCILNFPCLLTCYDYWSQHCLALGPFMYSFGFTSRAKHDPVRPERRV